MRRRKQQSSAVSINLTRRSLADLHEVETYSLKEWGRRAAEKYLDDISEALDRLREDPEILRLEPDFAPGLYFYRVKKHFLVCDLSGMTITVLTVIHASMDLPARLMELEPRLSAEAQILEGKLRLKRATNDRSQ